MAKVTKASLNEISQDPLNLNKHAERGSALTRKSIERFGARLAGVIDRENRIIDGNDRQIAFGEADLNEIEIIEASPDKPVYLRFNDLDLSDPENPARELQVALHRSAIESFSVDAENLLAAMAEGLDTSDWFRQDEIDELLAGLVAPEPEPAPDPGGQIDRAEELQEKWQVKDGDLWQIGEHFAICGDCREPETWRRLLQSAGIDRVNGVFTSPPYAMQRKDQYGGVPTAEYVDWWEALQANVKANLAADGSFFVNIKAHCEDGQRVLYCMDLVCAMVRRWGWRFVDELIWKKNGLPGGWDNRFKNDFEPVYHFSHGEEIKFSPLSVGHHSDHIRIYENGAQFAAHGNITVEGKFKSGIARPGNVIEVNGAEGNHAAAFPVALPDFFIRAYSDTGDVWCDPFLGSGTTIVAAHQNQRIGIGSERLPKYMAVILERLQEVVGITPTLLD